VAADALIFIATNARIVLKGKRQKAKAKKARINLKRGWGVMTADYFVCSLSLGSQIFFERQLAKSQKPRIILKRGWGVMTANSQIIF
jgi:hypothetical protein